MSHPEFTARFDGDIFLGVMLLAAPSMWVISLFWYFGTAGTPGKGPKMDGRYKGGFVPNTSTAGKPAKPNSGIVGHALIILTITLSVIFLIELNLF